MNAMTLISIEPLICNLKIHRSRNQQEYVKIFGVSSFIRNGGLHWELLAENNFTGSDIIIFLPDLSIENLKALLKTCSHQCSAVIKSKSLWFPRILDNQHSLEIMSEQQQHIEVHQNSCLIYPIKSNLLVRLCLFEVRFFTEILVW